MGKGKIKQASKAGKPPQMITPKMKWLGRMMKWAKDIKFRRHKKILMQQMTVSPVKAEVQHTLDNNSTTKLFKILDQHRPETKAAAKERVKENLRNGTNVKRPIGVTHGKLKVTQAIRNKIAKLVVIANDLNPLESVMWLSTLCIKMKVPFTIVKGRARLGTIVNQKTCCSLAFTGVKPSCAQEFDKLLEVIRPEWLEAGMYKEWGGGIKSKKTLAKLEKRAKRAALA